VEASPSKRTKPSLSTLFRKDGGDEPPAKTGRRRPSKDTAKKTLIVAKKSKPPTCSKRPTL